MSALFSDWAKVSFSKCHIGNLQNRNTLWLLLELPREGRSSCYTQRNNASRADSTQKRGNKFGSAFECAQAYVLSIHSGLCLHVLLLIKVSFWLNGKNGRYRTVVAFLFFSFFYTAFIISVYRGSIWENLVTSTFVPEERVTK